MTTMAYAIFISIIMALIFSATLFYVFNRRGPGPGNGIWFLFIIIFLFAWVGGGRVYPPGADADTVSWMGYALVAFFIMLLLAAALPAGPPRIKGKQVTTDTDAKAAAETKTVIEVTFGLFFWILIVSLLILGLADTFYSSGPVPVETVR